MLPVICIIVLVGEVAAVAAFLLIPDRGRWKRWAAGGLLAATVLLLAGVGGSSLREKIEGDSRNAAACRLAAEMIRNGRRAALEEALRRDWQKGTARLGFDEIAGAFLEAVQNAEGGR
ncbi:MAG: hypothetical protein L6W00_21830 [Lentisphaeria bacterium]|nr:MAG: hypothetical protein L6W00_21830 [Lentisphaeria bacterium]